MNSLSTKPGPVVFVQSTKQTLDNPFIISIRNIVLELAGGPDNKIAIDSLDTMVLINGIIPEGNYGAGTVIVWDTGTYITESDVSEQINRQ